jgi:hypothetical protein
MEALKRVVSNTVEKRLRNERGQPSFDLQFYVLARNGEHAGVSMYESHFAVCTEKGPATLPTESLYPGRP